MSCDTSCSTLILQCNRMSHALVLCPEFYILYCPKKVATATLVAPSHVSQPPAEDSWTCQVHVLESLHCMIGPGFMETC